MAPAKKKVKHDKHPKVSQEVESDLSNSQSKDVKFNKKRARILSSCVDVPKWSRGIVYWMSRDERVKDNWALLHAQNLALKLHCPLYICFCLAPTFLEATWRQYSFMIDGLKEVEQDCKKLNVSFHLLLGAAPDVLPAFMSEHKLGGLVTDFSPIRIITNWVKDLLAALPEDVPLCQVDAHNVVPCWVASDKLEYAARTIRRKITDKLPEFLTEFPDPIVHPYSPFTKFESVDWDAAISILKIDMKVEPVDWAIPGFAAGMSELHNFCNSGRLRDFSDYRNNPTKDALSNLSPWFHFGQISPQRCALEVNKFKAKYPQSVAAYLEESIVRRELADNFCFYSPDYDKLSGAPGWAQKNSARSR